LCTLAKANSETIYYYAGGQRVALRIGNGSGSTRVKILLDDRLGSTSITTDSNDSKIAELRYAAWCEVRFNSGTTPTDYTYTGQYSYTTDFGMMYYGVKWYDHARLNSAATGSMENEQNKNNPNFINNLPVFWMQQ
jgi:hypothetical protein